MRNEVVEEVIYEKLSKSSKNHADENACESKKNSNLYIDRMKRMEVNHAYKCILSDRKYIGTVVIFLKKVMRKLLKWYIEPICFQQTKFNIATTNAMKENLNNIEDIKNIIDNKYNVTCADKDEIDSNIDEIKEKLQQMDYILKCINEKIQEFDKNVVKLNKLENDEFFTKEK